MNKAVWRHSGSFSNRAGAGSAMIAPRLYLKFLLLAASGSVRSSAPRSLHKLFQLAYGHVDTRRNLAGRFRAVEQFNSQFQIVQCLGQQLVFRRVYAWHHLFPCIDDTLNLD